uniref:Uncharacterized protein n=1 Tax=Oryza brachyantha TaxID=4533 RepID=J3NET0_ORYBR
ETGKNTKLRIESGSEGRQKKDGVFGGGSNSPPRDLLLLSLPFPLSSQSLYSPRKPKATRRRKKMRPKLKLSKLPEEREMEQCYRERGGVMAETREEEECDD